MTYSSLPALAKKTIPEMVLRALGYTVIESTAAIEPVIYDVPAESKYGRFEPGLVMGVRFRCETTTAEGVTIEDHVFIGHNVTFINDRYPRATTASTMTERTRTRRGRLASSPL